MDDGGFRSLLLGHDGLVHEGMRPTATVCGAWFQDAGLRNRLLRLTMRWARCVWAANPVSHTSPPLDDVCLGFHGSEEGGWSDHEGRTT